MPHRIRSIRPSADSSILSQIRTSHVFPCFFEFRSNIDEVYGCAPEMLFWHGFVAEAEIYAFIEQTTFCIGWRGKAEISNSDRSKIVSTRAYKTPEEAYIALFKKVDPALLKMSR